MSYSKGKLLAELSSLMLQLSRINNDLSKNNNNQIISLRRDLSNIIIKIINYHEENKNFNFIFIKQRTLLAIYYFKANLQYRDRVIWLYSSLHFLQETLIDELKEEQFSDTEPTKSHIELVNKITIEQILRSVHELSLNIE